jgi:hypothetical protein
MSRETKVAATFVRMLAGWYQSYADEDRKHENQVAWASASAWEAAAHKANALAVILDDADVGAAVVDMMDRQEGVQ